MGEQSEVSLRSEQEGVRGREVCAGVVGRWDGLGCEFLEVLEDFCK